MQLLQIMWIMRSAAACVCINFPTASQHCSGALMQRENGGKTGGRRGSWDAGMQHSWRACHISCLTNCIRVFNMRPTGVDVDVRRMRRTFPCFHPATLQCVVASVTLLPQLPLQVVYLFPSLLGACVCHNLLWSGIYGRLWTDAHSMVKNAEVLLQI